MTNIKINLTCDHFSLKRFAAERIIRTCIAGALKEEGVTIGCEINVLITNDKGIRAINCASRNIDKATDVLSFPMFELTPGQLPQDWIDYLDPDTQLCPLGDMAISLERACAQAKEYGHSVRREIGYLTIHSVLHLLGYDHIDEGEQKKAMRAREEQIAATITGLNR